jgi:hypothetical protein
MRPSITKSSITPKWPIEVPTHTYGSPAAVYKVWFGEKYLIWKGKSLMQSATILADSIERYIRLKKRDPKSWVCKVCAHIKKAKCTSARIEVIDCDFIVPGTKTQLDVYRMLMLEQALLNEAGNRQKCLNNNEQAYIPGWMEEKYWDATQKFLRNWDKK